MYHLYLGMYSPGISFSYFANVISNLSLGCLELETKELSISNIFSNVHPYERAYTSIVHTMIANNSSL